MVIIKNAVIHVKYESQRFLLIKFQGDHGYRIFRIGLKPWK